MQSLVDIQKFLGVQPRRLESRQVKIHTRPLSEQIQNWDEVLSCLKGTKFENLLNDDDYTWSSLLSQAMAYDSLFFVH